MKPSSSGEDSSPSQSASIRRVQSQSNLRDTAGSSFPTGPEDVGRWIRRRKSIDTMSRFGVFELDDTSAARPPSEILAGLDSVAHPVKRKNAFRPVI
jgi:hypothetical protein